MIMQRMYEPESNKWILNIEATDSILTRRLIIMGNKQIALNRAWQNGFTDAYTPNANSTNNPYMVDTDLSEYWLRGYENAMILLYEPIED